MYVFIFTFLDLLLVQCTLYAVYLVEVLDFQDIFFNIFKVVWIEFELAKF